MKIFIALLFVITIAVAFNVSQITAQVSYQHKTENEIAALSPTERVNEYLKERDYHAPFDPVGKENDGRDQSVLIKDYIRKDGAKALPALANIANSYQPTRSGVSEQGGRFEEVFFLAEDIDNVAIRIRATEEGRAAIKVFADVLNRMKEAGYDDETHKWNKIYLAYMDKLKTMKGERISFTDGHIQDTLRIKHNINVSDEEMVKFAKYLTSLTPIYPSQCEIRFPPPPLICKDSEEFYKAYLKFKTLQ